MEENCRGREALRRWVLPLGMKLSPLRETEQIGRDKSMALFTQRRASPEL